MSNSLMVKSIYTGIFSIFIGIVTEKILIKCDKCDNFLTQKKKHNYYTYLLMLFGIGFIIRFVLEYIGFEAYCEKKCNAGKCDYVCSIKMNV